MFDDQGKTITTWLESSDSSTVFTRHCPFRCPFISVFKILLMEKIPISWKTVKGTEQFFAQKDKKLWEDGIMKLPEKWQRVVGKGLPRWHSGEASAGDIKMEVWSLGWKDPLEEEMATPLQYSCLEYHGQRRLGISSVHGVTESQTQLNDWAHTCGVEQNGEYVVQ